MNSVHITSKMDPIDGFNMTDPKGRPYVVEGDNASDLTIYFGSDTSRETYLDMSVVQPA